jgi:hypothetical protein
MPMQQTQPQPGRLAVEEEQPTLAAECRPRVAATPVSDLRRGLIALLDATRGHEALALRLHAWSLGLSLAASALVVKAGVDGVLWDRRVAELNLQYRGQIGLAERTGVSAELIAFISLGLLALGLCGWLGWSLANQRRQQQRLEQFWQRHLRQGAFVPLLLDNAVGKMLLELHHARLPGVAHLKALPEDPLGHLRAVAVHAEALAREQGFVERLQPRDLRLVVPFGAHPGWGLFTVLSSAWALMCTFAICNGIFFFGSRFDPFFTGIALALQIGPLAAQEFMRLSGRVSTGLRSILEQLVQ